MEKKKRLNFHAPLELADFAETEAKNMGISLTAYLNTLIYYAKKERDVIAMSNALQVGTLENPIRISQSSIDALNAKNGK